MSVFLCKQKTAYEMRISDWSSDVCSSDLTIRYYEKIGLLPAPDRTAGNYRSYSATHLGRLSFIRRARDLGFSIEQVRDLLGLSDQRDRPCEAVDAIAREHLSEVERKIRDLQALHRELASILRSEERRVGKECVRTGRYRWSPDHSKKKTETN